MSLFLPALSQTQLSLIPHLLPALGRQRILLSAVTESAGSWRWALDSPILSPLRLPSALCSLWAPPGPAPQLCSSSLLCGRNCPFLSSAFRVSPGALHPPAQQPPSQQCTRSSNRSAAQLSHSSGERRRNWRSEGLGSHLDSLRCISPIILSPQCAAQRFLATRPAPPVPAPH